jgi:hypothetical protein
MDFGPQYDGDDPFTARMRKHQSWWRAVRLGVAAGQDQRGSTYGNYLAQADAERGLNFLTKTIEWCARERMSAGGGVEEFRCTRNLLSSQPMAFNLFGPLRADPNVAAKLLDPILPGGVTAAQVQFEWAPDRESHLGDGTSMDVAIRYTTKEGKPALAGIETKLTEPFTRATFGCDDHRATAYRAVGSKSDVWIDPLHEGLSDAAWNQLWRNHLLVEAVRQNEPELLGCQVVVHHPDDARCKVSIAEYSKHLADAANSLRAITLRDIVDAWRPLVKGTRHSAWLNDFEDRYLKLELSDG